MEVWRSPWEFQHLEGKKRSTQQRKEKMTFRRETEEWEYVTFHQEVPSTGARRAYLLFRSKAGCLEDADRLASWMVELLLFFQCMFRSRSSPEGGMGLEMVRFGRARRRWNNYNLREYGGEMIVCCGSLCFSEKREVGKCQWGSWKKFYFII